MLPATTSCRAGYNPTMVTRLESRPALDFDLHFLADLFNRAFEGYFVPVAESPEDLAARLRFDSIDLALSRVAFLDDQAVGVVCVSVRGWGSRIAGMGVVPEARRRGAGRLLMDEAIARTRAVGLRHMVLEVIEQNTPAVELYRDLGFQFLRRLVGYELHNTAAELDDRGRRDASALEPADPREVARQLTLAADNDLPWQLAGETLAAYRPPVSGYHLDGKAFALIHDPGDAAILAHILVVPRGHRSAGWGSRLARALFALHEGRSWRIPARVPEDLAVGFLKGLGSARTELTQLELRLELDARCSGNTNTELAGKIRSRRDLTFATGC